MLGDKASQKLQKQQRIIIKKPNKTEKRPRTNFGGKEQICHRHNYFYTSKNKNGWNSIKTVTEV